MIKFGDEICIIDIIDILPWLKVQTLLVYERLYFMCKLFGLVGP